MKYRQEPFYSHRKKRVLQILWIYAEILSQFLFLCSLPAGYQKEKQEEVKKVKFTREESFVGFLSSFWDFFGKRLEGKEHLLDLLEEEKPRLLLLKKMQGEVLEYDVDRVGLAQLFHTHGAEITPRSDIVGVDF